MSLGIALTHHLVHFLALSLRAALNTINGRSAFCVYPSGAYCSFIRKRWSRISIFSISIQSISAMMRWGLSGASQYDLAAATRVFRFIFILCNPCS